MTDASQSPRRPVGPGPTTGDLQLSEERWAHLEPKLNALLSELNKIEELEGPELEPASFRPWGRDADERR
jgi:hypothetical protein